MNINESRQTVSWLDFVVRFYSSRLLQHRSIVFYVTQEHYRNICSVFRFETDVMFDLARVGQLSNSPPRSPIFCTPFTFFWIVWYARSHWPLDTQSHLLTNVWDLTSITGLPSRILSLVTMLEFDFGIYEGFGTLDDNHSEYHYPPVKLQRSQLLRLHWWRKYAIIVRVLIGLTHTVPCAYQSRSNRFGIRRASPGHALSSGNGQRLFNPVSLFLSVYNVAHHSHLMQRVHILTTVRMFYAHLSTRVWYYVVHTINQWIILPR